MSKNTLILSFVAILAITGGIFAQKLNSKALIAQNIASFNISLPDSTGKQRNLSEWKNKILVIHFWATWCPPCLKEIPVFIKLQKTYQQQGLQFIGIAIEPQEDVASYLASTEINYPVLIGGDNGIALSHQLGNSIYAVPYTLITDKQGNIIHQQPGEISEQALLKIISPHLQNK